MDSSTRPDRQSPSHASRSSTTAQSDNRKNLRTWVTRSGDKATNWKTALVKHIVTHEFIHYGDSLLLGSGTTFICLMQALVDTQIQKGEALDLAIVTSSLQVLYAARDAQLEKGDIFGNTQVILTGGRLNNSLDSLIGDYAALSVRSDLFNPRMVFFGAAGLSFRNGLNISYQFEEEISTQVAFATRPTVDRVLLVDHSKLGNASFYNAKLSLESLMRDAQTCYVITTFDPKDSKCMQVIEAESTALQELFAEVRNRGELGGKDFVFRTVREDGSVESELRLDETKTPDRPADVARPARIA